MDRQLRALVSGASVAGPTVAFWLARAGYRVTVVEKALQIRGGGYPIDIRGAAIDVIGRMGLLESVRAAHIHTRSLTVTTPTGRRIASVPTPSAADADGHGDVELPRGELGALLYEATRHDVEYRFDDSIRNLTQSPTGVTVEFSRGRSEEYDLVVGADGLHSNTRRLVFGPEEPFHRYLGHCFAGFSVPNRFGLDHEVVLTNTPGTMTALYAAGPRPELHALLAFRRASPSRSELADPEFGLRAVREAFAGAQGRTGWLVAEAATADDLFFDTLSQIVMPRWGRGRLALVGDAAAAPSFLSGEGTSLAIVGGYVLAAEIAAAAGDVPRASAAYETRMGDFVRRNQALAHTARRLMLPGSRAELGLRNIGLRFVPLLARSGALDRPVRRAADSVRLPEPGALARAP